jgi:selenide,water dikinase
LDAVLAKMPVNRDPNVLVGFDSCDDAGVYLLAPDLALVQTVDFFTPIVDDPFTFGAIAAANAVSDVYAMGGRPVSALAILCYPVKGDLDDLAAIMNGGAEKMREAICAVIGGHSVNDDEVKFGYAVTGTVHPTRVKPNAGARAGDALLLTKRLGTGIISTALKRGIAEEEHVRASVESMLELNRAAAERMALFDAGGCTDVTGFGLIGHAREMALASGVTLEIESGALEFLPGAVEYSAAGAHPGGLKNNREYAACDVELAGKIAPEIEALLYDPQTSGGLLLTLPESEAARFGMGRRVGRVLPKSGVSLRIV